MIKSLFRVMSFFNLNLDVAAPECLAPDFDYETKFYLTLAIPVGCALLLVLAYFGQVCVDRLLKHRSSTDKYAISRIIGTFLLLLYYTYLMLTRRALQIFNCNPTDPDDGELYTAFTSLRCNGLSNIAQAQSMLARSSGAS